MKKLVLYAIPLLLIQFATVQAQISWERHPEPVLPSWGGNFNDPSIYRDTYDPFVMFDSSSNSYKMWFSYRVYGSPSWCIGYAISADGINWFGYARNPVLEPGSSGSFDATALFTPFVIKVENELRMYYCGYNGSSWQVGVATSTDGMQWSKYPSNPILTVRPGTWESMAVNDPKIFHDEGQFVMFYSGHVSLSQAEIGIATSSNGYAWERHPQNPVLTRGPAGSWDQFSVRATAAFTANGKYYLLYDGGAYKPIGFANSLDGVSWTKYSGNPVFFPGTTWDAIRAEYGSIVRQGTQLKFWYSGFGYNGAVGGDVWQVGYATSDLVTTADGIMIGSPKEYRLSDAYPNPFNPETEIQYSVPETELVQIKIFDALGKEVATLVNEVQNSGHYTVRWTPSTIASGVYIYRMKAGSFSSSKKIVLLK